MEFYEHFMNIPIYKAEADAGLADKVKACAMAYVADVKKVEDDNLIEKCGANFQRWNKQANLTGLASQEDWDVYYTQSVLVSSNWNKNDDVFDRAEVWGARHTPLHKPTNLDHDEKVIVGHMTNNWAVDTNYNLLPNDIVVDDLPDLFHIIDGAVIYAAWDDDALNERTAKLISEIEQNKKCVSMECRFSNFDYALRKGDEYHIVARNEKTAYLTKHLRAYGGSGQHEGCRLGRLIRNLTFTGKGYVDKPANPYSIIFDKDNFFNFSQAKMAENPFNSNNSVLSKLEKITKSQEEFNMTVDFEKQITDLKSQLKTAEDAIVAVKAKDYEKQIEGLQGKVDAAEAKNAADAEKITQTSDSLEAAEKKLDEITAELLEVKTEKKKLDEQIAEAKAAQLHTDRVAKLVDGGVDKEKAEEKVKLYIGFSNEQFEDISKDIVAALPKEEKKEEVKAEEKDESDESQKAEADAEEALEDAEENKDEEVATAGETGEGDDELTETRKELRKAFAAQRGRKVEE